MINTWAVPLVRYILNVDKRRTSTNKPEYKTTDYDLQGLKTDYKCQEKLKEDLLAL